VPLLYQGFHPFFYAHCDDPTYHPLLERMGVLDHDHPAITADAWEAAGTPHLSVSITTCSPGPATGIYNVFAFRLQR
jgi:hypothetical protein